MDDVTGILLTATRMLFVGSLWIATLAKAWAWRMRGQRESLGMALAAGGAATQQSWWLFNEVIALAGRCNNFHVVRPSALCDLKNFLSGVGGLVTIPAMLTTAVGVGMLMHPLMQQLYGRRASTISTSVLAGLFAVGVAFGFAVRG